MPIPWAPKAPTDHASQPASPHSSANRPPWSTACVQNSSEAKAYVDLAKRVDEAIQFMMACGMDKNSAIFKETEFYVSHECLLMEYEQALTRCAAGILKASMCACGCVSRVAYLRALQMRLLGAAKTWLGVVKQSLEGDCVLV